MNLEATLERAMSWPCVVCQGEALTANVWAPPPELSRLIGEPPGKRRLVVYSVCATHNDSRWDGIIMGLLLVDALRDMAAPSSN